MFTEGHGQNIGTEPLFRHQTGSGGETPHIREVHHLPMAVPVIEGEGGGAAGLQKALHKLHPIKKVPTPVPQCPIFRIRQR